jgi:deoxycytidylate deaminase
MMDLNIPSLEDATEWIAQMKVPSWDAWFMGQVFFTLLRSPDQQTKQGAVLVDWKTKTYCTGYNGHPRGSKGLPTMREHSALTRLKDLRTNNVYRLGEMVPPDAPVAVEDEFGGRHSWVALNENERKKYIQQQPDKYKFMCHCETNALLQAMPASEHAVLYVTMPSCDMCAAYVLNHPTVKVKRIVYYEDRLYQDFLYQTRPDVIREKYDVEKNGEPFDVLIKAAQYCKLRNMLGQEMSKQVSLSYRN